MKLRQKDLQKGQKSFNITVKPCKCQTPNDHKSSKSRKSYVRVDKGEFTAVLREYQTLSLQNDELLRQNGDFIATKGPEKVVL